jgi:copper homeostasis protein
MVVEVCAHSFQSVIIAEKAGANRVELCVELGVGGITPSYGLIQKVVSETNIPVHILIRPRSGDFAYSKEEFEIMLADIQFCKEVGCSGIVSGVLHQDFSLDIERTQLLIEASKGMHFTFHRAFDWVQQPFKTIEILSRIGCKTILTSGQKPTAFEGLENLINFKNHAKNTIEIMPGGGVNKTNIRAFKEAGFKAIHFSATSFTTSLQQQPPLSMNSAKFLNETQVATSNVTAIQELITLVK